MREAQVFQHGIFAGVLRELDDEKGYLFIYDSYYQGHPVSLTMPVRERPYSYEKFPPFFEGLLPEGYQLSALLKNAKLDKNDCFGQLLQVGEDLVGSVTVKPFE